MSLHTSITTAPLDEPTATRIGKAITDATGLAVVPRLPILRRTCTAFDLPGVHEMLTDAADWDSDVWDMDMCQLPRLARAIEEVGKYLSHFTFRVAWTGHSAAKKVPILIGDLVKLIRENKIGNGVEYEVA